MKHLEEFFRIVSNNLIEVIILCVILSCFMGSIAKCTREIVCVATHAKQQCADSAPKAKVIAPTPETETE